MPSTTPDPDTEDDDFVDSIDAIDDEDTSQGEPGVKPWDPGKIRITTKSFTLREVVDQIRDGEIDLSPDFQRDYVWKSRQRTRLVESILLGIPLPAFYFNQATDGSYQVVDGVQRLSTISLFMRDGHELGKSDLEYLRSLDGLKFSQLDTAAVRRFRSTQIVVHVIEAQTPDEVKYDIFSRVNTLGSPLSTQEIRHAMSKSRSRMFLKDLSEMRAFDDATNWHYWRRDPDSSGQLVRDSLRMSNRELVLRFCAFRRYSTEEYRKHVGLDAFLVEYTRRLDGSSERSEAITDDELTELRMTFERAMVNAHGLLGKAAFRRWPPEQKRRGPINRAVFESQAIALADYSIDQLLPRKDDIVLAIRAAFNDVNYARSVTVATGNSISVSTRLEYVKNILSEVMK